MTKNSVQSSCLARGLKNCGYHVCVLGTIGSGKTTLSQALQKVIEEDIGRCEAFLEPVQENPILPLYYKDPQRYALTMQIFMLNRRLEQQRVIQDLALSGISSVQDSSVFGDSCFVEMLSKDGILGKEEVDVYGELFLNMARDIMYPSLIVYLNCSPETAKQRVEKRGRECEKNIPVEYLRNLNEEIKVVCDEFSKYTFVKEIDADVDLDEDGIKKLAYSIYQYLKATRDMPIVNRLGV